MIPSLKVETPATTTSSKSVCPSTSKLPFASIAPVKVDTPAIDTSSKSVCPSTSKSPFKVRPDEFIKPN